MLFILHADHEQNCSTNAVRGVGSSGVDPYSAVAAGVAALYGPLHGGANEAVLRMLRRIESVDNIPDFLERVKEREEKLMGFGHRVYKNYDPRARIIQQHMDEVFEATEYNPLVEIARELEKRALDDEYFTSRKLYPNVDFYSGIIYEALEIPTEMFTVIFAIPRTAGWIAQWMEMQRRPRAEDRPAAADLHRRARARVRAGRRARRARENRRAAGAAAETAAARRLSAPGVGPPPPDRLGARASVASSRRWKLTVRHGSEVEHVGASTTSTRLWRACASGRWRFGPRGRSRTSRCCATSGPRTRSRRGCSSPAGGCCASRSPGSTCAATGPSCPTAAASGARSWTRPATRRRSTWCARLWKRATMSDPSTEIPKGSYAAGRRVKLPAGAEPPFTVFINGIEQSEGADYEVARRRDRLQPRRSSRRRSAPAAGWRCTWGSFGTYRKDETVDLQFSRGGKIELVSDLPSCPTRRPR